MEQFRVLLKTHTAERGALTRLSKRSGIPTPVLGRWRDGIGRPTDTNLRKLAPALGVPYEDLAKMCGYLPGKPGPLDPRLALFLAEIENGWRAMDDPTRDLAERVSLAAFRVEDVRRRPRPPSVTTSPQGFDRDKSEDVQHVPPVRRGRRRYASQSLDTMEKQYGRQPLVA